MVFVKYFCPSEREIPTLLGLGHLSVFAVSLTLCFFRKKILQKLTKTVPLQLVLAAVLLKFE